MGKTATVRSPRSLQRRRIIQRPRLLAVLDESTARVRALVAPAGYGKTTLAEQWASSGGRRHAWYTARRASVDVAALALGVARACSAIVGDCEVRLREHLRAVSAAAENVTVLVEILSEDLEHWPEDAWLVIDDYQELVGASESETFVGELVAACPVQLLLTSRQRPSWVSARSILYGEVLELNQTTLAMDNHEAAEVLGHGSGRSASGLVTLANGWPAVIGLASVSSAEIGERDVPESLYDFFAEEVFDALGDEVREGLALLASVPVIDRELADELLGEERSETVCGAALDVGILVERNGRFELHPLARAFLENKESPASPEAVTTSIAHYRARRDWDAAFDLISRRNAVGELESLLLDALDDLLETARLSTIEAWCELAAHRGLSSPAFSLAQAETALRVGRHARAQAFAEAAAEDPALAFRAFSVGGRAAHLASREDEALELFRSAEAVADSDSTRRTTLWNQLLCEIELELPQAEATLARLTAGVRPSDPKDFVRAAVAKLSYLLRLGPVDTSHIEIASDLLRSVNDPIIESSFLSGYSGALALSCRYEEAIRAAARLRSLAQRYRLDFALPYASLPEAVARAGCRNWTSAALSLKEAEALASTTADPHLQLSVYSVRVRTLIQQGRHDEALTVPLPDLSQALVGVRGEVLGSRALIFAVSGRTSEALSIIEPVRSSSRSVEPCVLVMAVDAISGLKGRASNWASAIDAFAESALARKAEDFLVTAYRACPDLLGAMLRSTQVSERVVHLLRRVQDEDLAQQLGHNLLRGDPQASLSPREREVFQLLRQGLTNRQIAELLFIEESTVKVHVHHIYDKLGVRSRTALAVRAALERADQATSATAETGTDSGS